jgi:uncharacterized protein
MKPRLSQRRWPFGLCLLSVAFLAGCAANPFRSYDHELKATVDHVSAGALDVAIHTLEKNNTPLFPPNTAQPETGAAAAGASSIQAAQDTPADVAAPSQASTEALGGRDLLYYLEKGELLSLSGDYAKSVESWRVADTVIQDWENRFRTDPSGFFGEAGAYLFSERARRYEGHDYEKVFLSTRLALAHILSGRFDDARIEMKKTYERETLIKTFRELEYAKLEEEKETQNVEADTTPDQLAAHGYPLAELDTPEVRALKNGYQNTFAHYLAGYFFEMTGEPSLAEPGYRNALNLNPESRYIQDKLEGKLPKAGADEADVLFVVEAGFAPAWQSWSLTLPIPTGGGRLIATSVSFPTLHSQDQIQLPSALQVGQHEIPIEVLVNTDTLARRMLKDQMPTLLLRSLIRAAVKGVMQDQAQRHGGLIGGLIAAVAAVATEQADERAWRMLPGRVAIARAILPKGEHVLEIPTWQGVHKAAFTVSHRMSIVPVRMTEQAVYVLSQDNEAIGQVLPKGAVEGMPSPPKDTKGAAKATERKASKPPQSGSLTPVRTLARPETRPPAGVNKPVSQGPFTEKPVTLSR